MKKTREPKELDKLIGKRIKFRRMQKGFTMKELARRADISYQQLQKNEKGENRVPASRLQKLAKTLKVPVSYFLEGGETDIDNISDNPLRKAGKIYKKSTPKKRELLDKILSFLDKIL